MAEPFSVGSSILGVLSLGIQVTQTLVDYYDSVKGHSCEIIVNELQEEAQKIKDSPKGGLKNSVQNAARRVVYPFRESTLKKLNEDIQEIEQNLSLALDVLQLTDGSYIRNEVDEIKALLNLVRSSQVSDHHFSWLKAPDATINHDEACTKRNPGSGLWLLQHPDFRAWLDTSAENSFAWIHGFAGCGKSVLCSTAIQHIFAHRNANPNIGIAFFYFSFNDESKQNVSNMLRALVLQLSNQLDDGQSFLEHLKRSSYDASPSLQGLTDILKEMVQKFQTVYLIIDALDESQPDERNTFFQSIEGLLKHSHILVTSRDLPDIRERIQYLGVNISLKNDEVNKDISDFIAKHLEQDVSLQKLSAYHDRIQESLSHRANGVFRWVECQFRSLARCPRSKAALERCLASLPESLDETYERMLLNIDSNCREEAKRVFTLRCYAPRLLTVAEVIDGITVQLGETPCVDLDRRVSDEDDILQICPGFIDLSYTSKDSTPRLRIAHFSVQEYLESERILQQRAAAYGLSKSKAHAQLAEICLVYLLDPFFSEPRRSESIHLDRPFAPFAANHWHHYYRESQNAAAASNRDSLIMDLFLNRSENFRNWVQLCNASLLYTERYTKLFRERELGFYRLRILYASWLGLAFVISPLIKDDQFSVRNYGAKAVRIASSEGHLRVVELLLDKGVDPNSRGPSRAGALETASSHGHHEVVKLLLQKGANINAQGSRKATALAAASRRGHSKVVQLLLDTGADVSAQDNSGKTALYEAACEGHTDIAQLLLKNCATISFQNTFSTALLAAASRGHTDIAQLLLKYDARVSFQNTLNRALVTAASRGYKDLVELLLDNGADVNTYKECQAYGMFDGEYQYSAIQAAAHAGCAKTVQLLLDRGAQMNVTSETKGNALLKALSSGHYEIVQLLLSNGAMFQKDSKNFSAALEAAASLGYQDIIELLLNNSSLTDADVYGRKYGTALQKASSVGNEAIVQLLLKSGTGVHVGTEDSVIKDSNGAAFKNEPSFGNNFYGALQEAAQRGYHKIAQLLLDAGADVNADSGQYGSPLVAASHCGHLSLAQLLINSGANLNASGRKYGNALLAASFEGHEQVVQLLLDSGANVNAGGRNHGTALQAASFKGHEKLVQVLLDAGASINARGDDGEPGVDFFKDKQALTFTRRSTMQLVGTGFDALSRTSKPGKRIYTRFAGCSKSKIMYYCTALQIASHKGYKEVVSLLLDKDADINAPSKLYGSALQAAMYDKEEDVAELLLSGGADINMYGGALGSALQAASGTGKQRLARILISMGADVNMRGGEYNTALQAAASGGYMDLVKFLIDNGADVNASGEQPGNALEVSASGGFTELTKLLIKRGANVEVNILSRIDFTTRVEEKNRSEIIQILLDEGADVNAHSGRHGTALHTAISSGSQEVIQILLNNGADVNIRGGDFSALEIATYIGDVELVRVLLDKGADVNASGDVTEGLLATGCFCGDEDIVEVLLDSGADVNGPKGHQGAAIRTASREGHQGIIKLLLERGADINAQEEGGESALQAAVVSGSREVVELLLNEGAEVNDSGGRYGSALQAAIFKGYDYLAQLLLDRGANNNALKRDDQSEENGRVTTIN